MSQQTIAKLRAARVEIRGLRNRMELLEREIAEARPLATPRTDALCRKLMDFLGPEAVRQLRLHAESLERDWNELRDESICQDYQIEKLKAATLQGMDAVIELVGAHGEISAWPEWDACSRFVHDNSALVSK